jgi:hypothetical protein
MSLSCISVGSAMILINKDKIIFDAIFENNDIAMMEKSLLLSDYFTKLLAINWESPL